MGRSSTPGGGAEERCRRGARPFPSRRGSSIGRQAGAKQITDAYVHIRGAGTPPGAAYYEAQRSTL